MLVKPPKKLKSDVQRYAQMLAATGMEEREVMRAAYYANEYGLDALTGPGCVTFDVPMCLNPDCLRPDHQRVSK
jgi:hypothetical protein